MYILQSHDTFYAYLKEKNVTYTIRVVFNNPDIFMGISIQLNNDSDYAKVAGWEGVKTITPVYIVTLPPIEGRAALPVDD